MRQSVNARYPRRGLPLAATLALLVVVSATACSSGARTPTGVAAGGNTPSTAPSGLASNPTRSTVKATGGGDFCKLVATGYNKAITQGAPTDNTPAGLKKRYEQVQADEQHAIDAAPSAIKADMEISAAASNKFFAALAAANYDFTKLAPDATAAMSTPEVTAAGARLVAYVKDHCGIDLPGRGASPASTTTAPGDAATSAEPTTAAN